MCKSALLPVLVVAFTCGVTAQAAGPQVPDPKLEFEVASVKPSAPDSRPRTTGGPGSKDPSRYVTQALPLFYLVSSAYTPGVFQLSAPDWMRTSRFDINAKLPEGTTREQFRIMLQNLLAERFKLAVHREMRELPVYEMVVRGNRPKLRESAGPSSAVRYDKDGLPIIPTLSEGGQTRIDVINESMEHFTKLISGFAGGPVRDATGLKGRYDIVLTFGNNLPRATPADGVASASDPDPGIFTAMEEQLGLKLVRKKAMLEVLVVDHAEKVPTAN